VAGFIAGFARAGLGFFAAIAGLLFGFWFYGIPGAWIHKFIGSETVSNILGFFVVLFLFSLAGTILGKIFSKMFRWTGLSWLDRMLGAGFGFVRGGIICAAFVAVLLAFTPQPLPSWMVDSKLLPYAVDASNVLAAMAPNSVKEGFHRGVDEIRKTWDEQLKKSRERDKKQLKKVEF
jgi:membrane protein required for colicin V production